MEDLKWDKDRLYQLVQGKLGDHLFLVVSNREPYIHTVSGDKIVCNRPVSGLTEALDPVMRASRGSWVAHGSGDADKKVVDDHDRVADEQDVNHEHQAHALEISSPGLTHVHHLKCRISRTNR